MELVVIFAGRYLMYLEFIVLGVGLLLPTTRQVSLRAWIAAAFASGLGFLVKDFFYFPRPFITSGVSPILPYLLDGSIPSNHTAAAVAIAVTIFLFHQRWGLLFGVLAILIATGRVVGGVHSYLDVFLGSLLGLFSALTTMQLVNWLTGKLTRSGY